MRKVFKNLTFVFLVELLLVLIFLSKTILAQPSASIVLKPTDHGYISHIEFLPKLQYTHLSLTASKVAKELLAKALQEDVLDQ